jgi:hypothetical protein
MQEQFRHRSVGRGASVGLLALALFLVPALQAQTPADIAPAPGVDGPQSTSTPVRPEDELVPQMVVEGRGPTEAAGSQPEAPPAGRPEFWPALEGPGLTWFAIVVILALTLRLRPLLSERNLDGLVWAAMCLLLSLRTDWAQMPAWAAGKTAQWWSYVLLSVAAGYFLLRGLLTLANSPQRHHELNVSGAALLVLLAAGLIIDIREIATAPLSTESRDCLVGGLYTAESGRLPYGQIEPHDRRSPWLYLLHAAAVRAVPPTFTPSPEQPQIEMSWANRQNWQDRAWWIEGDFAPARLVNGLLFVLALAAVYAVCARLHSPAVGLTAVAIWSVFPGTVECLTNPGIVLASALAGWSLFFAMIPAVGPFLSMVLAVAAGLAWPWAFLLLPVLLGYFFRTSWPTVSALFGLAAAAAGAAGALVWLTLPMPPRADGALRMAGQQPAYAADLGEDGVLRVSIRAPGEPAHHGILRPLWRFLAGSESLLLDVSDFGPGTSRVYLADGVVPQALWYRNLEPTQRAREEIGRRYRSAVQREPLATRFWVSLRCVLEQTWLAAEPAEPPVTSAWTLWAGPEPGSTWGTIRRAAKLAAAILALITGIALMRRLTVQPAHLAAGLLVAACATLLCSNGGAVTNLVWLLPPALAVWAACETSSAAPASVTSWPTPAQPPPKVDTQ